MFMREIGTSLHLRGSKWQTRQSEGSRESRRSSPLGCSSTSPFIATPLLSSPPAASITHSLNSIPKKSQRRNISSPTPHPPHPLHVVFRSPRPLSLWACRRLFGVFCRWTLRRGRSGEWWRHALLRRWRVREVSCDGECGRVYCRNW